MKNARNGIAFTLAIFLSLPATIFSSPTLPIRQLRKENKSSKPKLAPDLAAMLAQDDQDEALRLQGKTLAEVRHARLHREQADATTGRIRVNGVTLSADEVAPEEKQSFIVQLNGSTPDVVWQEKLARLNGRVSQKIGSMGLVTIEAPRNVIRQLAAEGSIGYISPDRPVHFNGHLEATTGSTQIRNLSTATMYDGRGIGIAISPF